MAQNRKTIPRGRETPTRSKAMNYEKMRYQHSSTHIYWAKTDCKSRSDQSTSKMAHMYSLGEHIATLRSVGTLCNGRGTILMWVKETKPPHSFNSRLDWVATF